MTIRIRLGGEAKNIKQWILDKSIQICICKRIFVIGIGKEEQIDWKGYEKRLAEIEEKGV